MERCLRAVLRSLSLHSYIILQLTLMFPPSYSCGVTNVPFTLLFYRILHTITACSFRHFIVSTCLRTFFVAIAVGVVVVVVIPNDNSNTIVAFLSGSLFTPAPFLANGVLTSSVHVSPQPPVATPRLVSYNFVHCMLHSLSFYRCPPVSSAPRHLAKAVS